ncbi:hypothetical protein NHQ30_002482 [Ciborinia camelliae]|nr:hypothetical protein NHQ30_002482 [Ciborinia camelliae]
MKFTAATALLAYALIINAAAIPADPPDNSVISGNAVTPGNTVTPDNTVTPGNAVTEPSAESNSSGVYTADEVLVAQEDMDSLQEDQNSDGQANTQVDNGLEPAQQNTQRI